MAADYLIRERRDEENLSNLAGLIRREAKLSGHWRINIVDFILNILPTLAIKGKIYKTKIEFIPETDIDPAYVKFKPALILCVKKTIWNAAQKWNKEAIFILAHELGHIFLHREIEKGYSAPENLKFQNDKEYSVEWQANTFAKFFLMPDNILIQFDVTDTKKLSDECAIPLSLAQERQEEIREFIARKARVQASIFQEHQFQEKLLCPSCGSYALPDYPAHAPCEECGSKGATQADEGLSYSVDENEFLL